MKSVPRVTIGLPVYNGEKYLAEALKGLLSQSYSDFELVISDNASSDATEDICRRFAASDSRVRYIRQPRNLGCTWNHNVVAADIRGEFFKWASHDDTYGPSLLAECVAALDHHREVVAAHSWTATIDGAGTVLDKIEYPLATASRYAPERFRSMLFDVGGDDAYAVVRADVMRKVLPYGSFYRADRTIVAALALHGPFHQVRDWLFFRRDHAERATRTPTVRSWCVTMDPRRADRLRYPTSWLITEYVWAYVRAIRSAPLSSQERRHCYRHLGAWLASRARLRPLDRDAMPGREGRMP